MKQPLATRMRPTSLSEVVGQDHLIGDGQILTRMVNTGQITSILLYGPPGIGKTSIAHALSCDLGVPFGYFNAGVHPKKDLQDIAKKGTPGEPVIALIDEVHRLDKPKQDFLLMQIEDGSLIMVGATTENPYISINPALRSRSHIFELKPVTPENIAVRLRMALSDTDRGLGDVDVDIANDLLVYIGEQTNGDIRAALNTLDLAVMSTAPDGSGMRMVTRDVIDTCLQQRQIGGDKDGDSHYNLLSAFQKSIRGSDADAALHYLARLIQAGDLVSIMRRLLVIAYEDISLASPELGQEALAAVTVAERVGLPEARIPLAQITVRLALSPKSNVAYKALDRATEALKSGRNLSVPKHLQDAHYKGAAKLGRGVGYKYPHDFPYGITNQQYLPDDYARDRYLVFRDTDDTEQAQNTYHSVNCAVKP
ncbi:replication-associated recombination protein A [Salipaludibacillus agaradhaerens]|nr:replication-associated recombination protein A [Salipaludibacillus agaradhaerens]MCR6108598.1 replication-associated recombination protein A [Salipaludibacillus agaradhaerens]MCR6120627.1 replication-associated recombination protein A [Salipaludibacillus agaradhaerens]